MCGITGLTGEPDVTLTTEELNGFDSDLDMPRDEDVFANGEEFVAALKRESTAPHAGLEQRVVILEDIVERQAELIGILQAALDQRTDRIARSLTHLALAVTELRNRRTLGQRFAAWWRENVYRGPYLGDYSDVPYEDDEPSQAV